MNEKFISEIEGFEDFIGYSVTEEGKVYSFKKRVGNKWVISKEDKRLLKGNLDSKGYLYVDLKNNKIRKCPKIHRLVALAFIENNNPLFDQINHIDGNKTNNHISNLEWCDSRMNQIHAIKTGLKTYKTGEDNKQYNGYHTQCKKVNQYDLKGNYITTHRSIAIAARSLNSDDKIQTVKSRIGRCCRGVSAKPYAHGYIWKFA